MVVLEAASADEWEDVVSSCFIPLSCVSFASGFHGRMDHLSLGRRISVSTVSTDGTMIERSEKLTAKSHADDLHLSMQVASSGTVRQGRRMVSVQPGSATMYATDVPYSQDYSHPGQRQLIVQISRDALDVPNAVIAAGLDRLAVPASDAVRVFFTYSSSLQKRVQHLGLRLPPDAADIASDLASTMIRSSVERTRLAPRTPGGLLWTIEDFVGANLAHVRVDDIASAFFISRRSVYNLFERLDTTPSDYVRRKRLGVAASRLIDLASRSVSIGEIGADAGFEDSTTFTRAFRREYGVTPREWRLRRDPSSSAT